MQALQKISSRHQRDLGQLLQERFQLSRPEDLSVRQASQLIDEFKASNNGQAG